MKLEKFLRQNPVFTDKEFVKFLGSKGALKARAQESLLAYHTRTGRLLRVRRGLYAVVPVGVNPETYPFDPFLLAAKMVDDSVLAYHTALEFHGKAYSVQSQFSYLTRRAARSLTFRTFNFRPVMFPKSLRAKRSVIPTLRRNSYRMQLSCWMGLFVKSGIWSGRYRLNNSNARERPSN